MLRELLLSMSRNDEVRKVITTAPFTRDVVKRYVPGESIAASVTATQDLAAESLFVTIDRLGEDVLDEQQANDTVVAYEQLLKALGDAGLGHRAEVSVKLSAVGQALGENGNQLALDNARRICQAAANIGTTVTLDMEDHTTTDATLATLRELRKDFPFVGAVLQAYLYRTEEDCRQLAYEGSRVRLCKGAYKEPEEVAYQQKIDVDLSYVRCMRILLEGKGYPMFATHDPRMIEIGKSLVESSDRSKESFEFQMLYGIRPEEQKLLAAEGYRTRIYVPYGEDWYGYFMRRLAERPANLMFFARSLVSKN
jgi:proline dehydrogenase